jgi:hypothetical protein
LTYPERLSNAIHMPLLYSQFQGALWGAVVAQAYATWPEPATPQSLWQDPTWLQRLETVQLPLLASLPESTATFADRELRLPTPQPDPSWSTATQIVTTLPLGLYYHDQPKLLAKHLQTHLQVIQALALLPWVEAILQVLDHLLLQNTHPNLPNLPNLGRLADTPEQQAIARGMTCFQETPSQFWLSLNRAKQWPQTPELATLTVGILAGAYNGYVGLPLLAPEPIPVPLRQRANHLYAHWCGMDSITLLSPETVAIGNPGLRPRS